MSLKVEHELKAHHIESLALVDAHRRSSPALGRNDTANKAAREVFSSRIDGARCGLFRLRIVRRLGGADGKPVGLNFIPILDEETFRLEEFADLRPPPAYDHRR